MPYYNEQDLEGFVEYLDNDTQTEDLSDSKDEKAMTKNVKFVEVTREIKNVCLL
jgi:hypothetical protein